MQMNKLLKANHNITIKANSLHLIINKLSFTIEKTKSIFFCSGIILILVNYNTGIDNKNENDIQYFGHELAQKEQIYRGEFMLPSREAILVMYCLASVSALSSSSTKKNTRIQHTW